MMILSALLASAVVSLSDTVDVSPDMEAFAKEASDWVLEGQPLPLDYRLRLLAMKPADRLQAIVFLRRSGLLKDHIWPLDDVLRDAAPENQADE